MNPLFIISLSFVSVALLSFAVLYQISLRNSQVKKRLENLSQSESTIETQSKTKKESFITRSLKIFSFDSSESSYTKYWLAQAGYYKEESVYDFYAFTVGSAIVFGVATLIVTLSINLPFSQVLIFTGLGIIVGGLAPRLWVTHKIGKRRESISRAVPNMLDLLVVCVEAGLSLTAAIQRLADEMRTSCKPLSDELHVVTKEVLIGKSKGEAFRALSDRTGVDELRNLAVTLIQAEKLGTSISHALRVLAASMRLHRRQRAEILANKAAVKLVFPLVFLIFPELLVVLMGPAVINFIRVLGDVAQ
jgi:tight adherence protein C